MTIGTAEVWATGPGPLIAVPRWVHASTITNRAFRLYVTLAYIADNRGIVEGFSQPALAEELACSIPSFRRALDDLVTAGAVTVLANGGGWDTASYQVHVEQRDRRPA